MAFDVLYNIFCLQALIVLQHVVSGDQIRGAIVDPNAQSTRPQAPVTPDVIYFLTTPSEIGGDNNNNNNGDDNRDYPNDGHGGKQVGKWVRRTTQMPRYERTSPGYGGGDDGPTEPGDPDDRYNRGPFGRTTSKYRPLRVTTPPDDDDDDRYGSGRPDSRETTEDPYYQRYRPTTDRYSRFGQRTTADPFDRYASRTTDRYDPFRGSRYTTPSSGDDDGDDDRYGAVGRRTTPDYYSGFGRRTTESPFDRYLGRTTDRYSSLGRYRTTDRYGGEGDGDDRYGSGSRFGATTDRYSPFIRTTPDYFSGFGRRTTER